MIYFFPGCNVFLHFYVIELLSATPDVNNEVDNARRRHLITMAQVRTIESENDVKTSGNCCFQLGKRFYPFQDEINPKLRSGVNARVKHAVGMIMKHKAYAENLPFFLVRTV